MFIFQLFQIYSGLLSRIHPICKAMGLVNTHALLIWKALWGLFRTSGPIRRLDIPVVVPVGAGSSLEDPIYVYSEDFFWRQPRHWHWSRWALREVVRDGTLFTACQLPRTRWPDWPIDRIRDVHDSPWLVGSWLDSRNSRPQDLTASRPHGLTTGPHEPRGSANFFPGDFEEICLQIGTARIFECESFSRSQQFRAKTQEDEVLYTQRQCARSSLYTPKYPKAIGLERSFRLYLKTHV